MPQRGVWPGGVQCLTVLTFSFWRLLPTRNNGPREKQAVATHPSPPLTVEVELLGKN